jgi:hypothetical protein
VSASGLVSLSFEPLSFLLDAAQWLDDFLQRKQRKATIRAANMLYHSGIVVGSMRVQRDNMRALLLPLQNFNEVDWSTEKRSEWIRSLREFAYGLRDIEEISSNAYALSHLDVKPTESIRPLRDRIVDLAFDLTHAGRDRYDAAPTGADLRARAKEQEWLDAAARYEELGEKEARVPLFRPGTPDLVFQYFLGALLWLVRNAKDAQTMDDLRKIAAGLLMTRSKARARPIDDVVNEALRTFGKLMGLLKNQYPELGEPRWLGNVTSVTHQ